MVKRHQKPGQQTIQAPGVHKNTLAAHFAGLSPVRVSPPPFSNQAVQRFAQTCPLALPGPGRCPFGGICHACPPQAQAKLKIGQPGDKYEREADRVADFLFRSPTPPGSLEEEIATLEPGKVRGTPAEGTIQRQSLPSEISLRLPPLSEEEEEEVRPKPRNLGNMNPPILMGGMNPRDISTYTAANVSALMEMDLGPALDENSCCPENSRLIAGVVTNDATHFDTTPTGELAPKVGNKYFDFHFYKQDDDGFYSHKPGTDSSTRVDARRNKIRHPYAANRTYANADYTNYAGTFCIR
jgi:hypothetical protein